MEEKQIPNHGHTPMRRRAICSSCRRRKSKCDSREPQCSTCIAHKSHCYYDKPPSLAYVRSLEAKIEKLLQEKEARSSGTGERNEDKEHFKSPSEGVGPASPFATRPVDTISELSSPPYQVGDVGRNERRPSEHWVSEISVDSRGGVCYHGPTSSFHEAPSKDGSSRAVEAERLSNAENDSFQDTHRIRDSLVSNAAAQRHLEVMAIENITGVQNEVTTRTANELLKYHWCWIHPTFQFVYRPAFTRDMALSSHVRPETSYFSETLLKVLLGHCSRFRAQRGESANTIMERLTQQARVSIGLAISEPSSIPMIQALLQQSAREVAFANSSQAWLYSGMASRMAIDLGIHLPNDKLRVHVKGLTAEDIEIRKRCFWSCYNWDKVISLYCGRMPAFIPPVDTNAPEFMDGFTENEPWMPYYGNEEQQSSSRPQYLPQSSYMVSSFTSMCKLCIILSDIMLEIYDASPESQDAASDTGSTTQNSKNSAFIRISSSIRNFWNELPEVIRLNIKGLPILSPPLHIVSLNLLYHTTLILLHRPFIIGATDFQNAAVSRSYQICVAATAAIHDLLQLITSTFGYGHTTYLNCYSTYIAATIAVLQFQLQDETIPLPPTDIPSEKLDLKFFLGVLQRSATAMPGLNRSVDIVKRHMQTILDRRAKRYLDSLFPTDNINNYLSALSKPGHQHHPAIANTAHSTDQVAQPQTDESFQSYSGFSLEGLPAFPGQNFNVGTDFTLDQEITDPEMRAALLGLDPHLTLHHENSDWTYGGFYMGDQMQ
ncbi:hypothetical protein BDZ45DRAFT_390557 [Acephala macrosclerotiorum]|nr:hypothetical protein BDZ45DRAFT_390557 [Acephala macrosclerotiorum]